MYYKCIKDYRKKLSNNSALVFTKGMTYLREQVVNKVPMCVIPEYFTRVGEEVDSTPITKGESESCSSFNTLLDQIKDTHEKKNHDYGNSFAKSMEEFGMLAAAIRLSDKLSRFKTLIKEESQVKDESVEDTLLDMAAYAIMTVEYIRSNKT